MSQGQEALWIGRFYPTCQGRSPN